MDYKVLATRVLAEVESLTLCDMPREWIQELESMGGRFSRLGADEKGMLRLMRGWVSSIFHREKPDEYQLFIRRYPGFTSF